MDKNLNETTSNKEKKIDYLNTFFKELYINFNARKIESVIEKMTDDIQWANGMDGGSCIRSRRRKRILVKTI